ncbi:MAG TPA: histidine kinase, partial [Vicinamibacterales bacterium]|nr:histidine kinase [Vicinamibacterales bacterium]
MSALTQDHGGSHTEFTPRFWHALIAGPIVGILSGTLAYWVQIWINPRMATNPIGQYWNVVAFNVFVWTTWVLFMPVIWWLAGRVRITRERLVAAVVFHLACSVVLAAADCAIAGTVKWRMFTAAGVTSSGPVPLTYSFFVKDAFLYTFEWKVLLYWGVVGVQHAMAFAGEARRRALSEARIEQRLVEARLEALLRQLQPHFLFNTLHAIASVVHTNPDAAESMLVRLGDLLRAIAQSQARHEVTLARELELLREYVELQKLRFGSRLRVEFDVPEALNEGLVPVLLLQPLVENAIKHGLAHRAGEGKITISARRHLDSLEIVVADDGPPSPGGSLKDRVEGVGLANTKARLEHLYPGQWRADVSTPPEGGFVVTMGMPWRAPAPLPRPADAPAAAAG